jgi:SAM-dependent methyltransferase
MRLKHAAGELDLSPPRDLWEQQSTQWRRMTAPGRPSAPDLAFNESIVRDWSGRHGAPRVLLLGVTPELAGMAWPAGTQLLAVDCCPAMVRNVWPGFPRPGEGGLCADWLNLPLPRESRDLVVGDGPFGVLRYADQHRKLVHSVLRVLKNDGLFLARVFIRPDVAESPESVIRDLMAARIGNFHTFKFRLAMALQPDTAQGVRVADVWEFWNRNGPGPEAVAARLGWPLDMIAAIDAYRGQDAIYYFPTVREMQAILAEGFTEVRTWFPSYELGERCPTFVCAGKRSGGA